MNARALHRFTVEDYYRMAETGVISPGARVELLDGQIVDMMANLPPIKWASWRERCRAGCYL